MVFDNSKPLDDELHVALLAVELATASLRRGWKKVLHAIENSRDQGMLEHTVAVAHGFALGLLAGELTTTGGYQAMTALISKSQLIKRSELRSSAK
ncbi:hypothetical protein [Pseudomonas trivialis]|uniref:Uncharacterized protein n=1 Tax=Pseudomonas trivialis TaxID=200450 RepID=A0A0H5A457_9PSED|nr:hypothetical protein [Pseudomonas trivialis]AKS04668.1 hypothetical protein AA957_00545 [Pseudomonas trivialis]